jgi:hypothetical protein
LNLSIPDNNASLEPESQLIQICKGVSLNGISVTSVTVPLSPGFNFVYGLSVYINSILFPIMLGMPFILLSPLLAEGKQEP